jgi:uncharacterized protein YjiS (DUF1127 family)
MAAGAGASHDFMRKTRAGKRKDALRASGRSLYLKSSNAAFHEIWSLSMSSFITDPLSFPAIQLGDPAARVHQPNSGSATAIPWRRWFDWAERRRQRIALRELADDKHFLSDLGLTREQALDEANKPFWR